MGNLNRLENWFYVHCDNDWEHGNRIQIYNLDNPGWGLKVDLEDTLLEEVLFEPIGYGDSEDRNGTWINCYKQESVFTALGSYNMLEKIIEIFLDWAESNTDTTPWDKIVEDLRCKCMSYKKVFDKVAFLRQIYWEIRDIPNEHPDKRKLIELFNDCWNEVKDSIN